MKLKNKIASFFGVLFINSHQIIFSEKIKEAVRKMGLSEKIIFSLISLVLIISGLKLLYGLNNLFLVEIPTLGGSFTEGIIGRPRFINPVLAISDADKDMTSLVYSGLLKITEDGSFEPDLASSYEIKNSGTLYDFVIKDNAYFHDGKKVTADDVIFTVRKILDPVIKSPKKINWEGVTVEKINDKEVSFTLNKPYAPFLYALTSGILPKHIWGKASSEEFPFSQFNIDPIGSGPYKVEKISRNSGGIPASITLSSWKKYVLNRPKIKSIIFKFFQNETELIKAYNDKSVSSASGLSPITLNKMRVNGNLVNQVSLPRVFGVFFNQNIAPIFLSKEIREALDQATPKKAIVDEALYGFGKVINGPTPNYIERDAQKALGDAQSAKSSLLKAGWEENKDGILEKRTKNGTIPFSFSISTTDAPGLKKTAEMLREAWRKIGASVSIKVFEAGDLSQNVIRPRKYDALLFGEIIGEESDLYPFWHSSERNDPGLNISLYANITVDKMLEEIQKENDSQNRLSKKETIFSEIKKDMPAVFLFSPDLLYIKPSNVKNITIKNISFPSERFLFINKWFIETDKVWKIFSEVN